MIPAGADPHHYEPNELELVNSLREASLVVMSGPSHLIIEEKIKELKSRGIIKVRIIDYSDYAETGLKLLKNPRTGQINPHGYFFSISGIKAIAITVAKVLAEIDPEGAEYYNNRLKSFLKILDEINSSAHRIIKNLNVKVVLFSPVTQYIINDLGFEIRDVMLLEYDVELSEDDLNRIFNLFEKESNLILVLTDRDVARFSKLLDILTAKGVKYTVAPIFKNVKKPEYSVLLVASSIYSAYYESIKKGETGKLSLLLNASLITNFVLAFLLILIFYRLRGEF